MILNDRRPSDKQRIVKETDDTSLYKNTTYIA